MLDWLDELPDMRVSGVHGVQSVLSQKTVGLACTPGSVQPCASTPVHPSAHPVHTEDNPERMAEIRHSTPRTPCTPNLDDEWGLPDGIRAKLARLSLLPPRKITLTQPLWAALVCDTMLFAKRGWAAKAMALGWSELELFGIAPRGWQGVTSRLIGREVLGLDARKIAVKDGRHVAQLPRETLAPGAVPIWEALKQ